MSKRDLHEMVEALPEKDVPVVRKFLQFVLNEPESEDLSWLEADLADLPPYDWGPEGPPAGRPVRYLPGVGLVVEEDKE